MEHLLNFVYFLTGLIIGVLSLWQNQRYFLANQQNKFDKIDEKLDKLTQHIIVISESTSARTHERDIRYISTFEAIALDRKNPEIRNRYKSELSENSVDKLLAQESITTAINNAVQKESTAHEKD